MSNVARAFSALLLAALVSGCGSGGDPTRNQFFDVAFTSFQAIRSGQGHQIVHITGSSQNVTGSLDTTTGDVTSAFVGAVDTAGSTLTLTYPAPDSSGNVDLTRPMVDIKTPATTLSSSSTFGTSCANTLCIVTPTGSIGTKLILADSTSLGWNYQTFGIWSQEL